MSVGICMPQSMWCVLQHALLQRCDLEYPATPLKEVIDDCNERYVLRLTARWKRKTALTFCFLMK